MENQAKEPLGSLSVQWWKLSLSAFRLSFGYRVAWRAVGSAQPVDRASLWRSARLNAEKSMLNDIEGSAAQGHNGPRTGSARTPEPPHFFLDLVPHHSAIRTISERGFSKRRACCPLLPLWASPTIHSSVKLSQTKGTEPNVLFLPEIHLRADKSTVLPYSRLWQTCPDGGSRWIPHLMTSCASTDSVEISPSLQWGWATDRFRYRTDFNFDLHFRMITGHSGERTLNGVVLLLGTVLVEGTRVRATKVSRPWNMIEDSTPVSWSVEFK